jgi:hypothetical protein
MNGILGTDGVSILSRYMTAMAAAQQPPGHFLTVQKTSDQNSRLSTGGCVLNLNQTHMETPNE